MAPDTAQTNDNDAIEPGALEVRRAIDAINSLDADTAEHLNALAFVLMRVASADGLVDEEERRRMERILVDQGHIPAGHAALVTEISRHRTELADCGSSYAISRELRSKLDPAQRSSVLEFLLGVADADGCVSGVEHDEVAQIAGELGLGLES